MLTIQSQDFNTVKTAPQAALMWVAGEESCQHRQHSPTGVPSSRLIGKLSRTLHSFPGACHAVRSQDVQIRLPGPVCEAPRWLLRLGLIGRLALSASQVSGLLQADLAGGAARPCCVVFGRFRPACGPPAGPQSTSGYTRGREEMLPTPRRLEQHVKER